MDFFDKRDGSTTDLSAAKTNKEVQSYKKETARLKQEGREARRVGPQKRDRTTGESKTRYAGAGKTRYLSKAERAKEKEMHLSTYQPDTEHTFLNPHKWYEHLAKPQKPGEYYRGVPKKK